jgi:uncharacterized surface protein with fasciclin (FAS1) repeats
MLSLRRTLVRFEPLSTVDSRLSIAFRNVQVSDTTGDDICTAAGFIKNFTIKTINMKKAIKIFSLALVTGIFSCNNNVTEEATNTTAAVSAEQAATGGQENVQDDESEKNVVKVAISSKDHTTLVAAIKQADLVTSLTNAGPFTVFAPTNAAFDALPAGTVEGLMKDEKKADLQNILQYHVAVSTMKAETFTDGQTIGMVNGDNVTVSVKDGKVTLNGNAHIVASIPASNGIIHVVDAVLLPPAKK